MNDHSTPPGFSSSTLGGGKRHSALGVFIFAGGFTVGVSEHFDVAAHFEEGPFGVETFKANFPRIPVYTDPDAWPLEKARKVEMLYGNPHCSPWSPVGRRMFNGAENWRTDPNTQYARKFMELGFKIKPPVWVMESVPQIQKSDFLRDMAQQWHDLGYSFTVAREDAKFMGLPQQRRRAFMVASRYQIPWEPPNWDGYLVMAGEALEVDPGPFYPPDDFRLDMLKELKFGQSFRDVWHERYGDEQRVEWNGRTVGRPAIMEHHIDPYRPSGTIIGVQCYYHPHLPRPLGVGEMAVLCGYPERYRWRGTSIGDMVAQVGKSVTPPAARWLAGNISRALDAAVPAEPRYHRYTCWAPSTRVVDNRIQDIYEEVTAEGYAA